MGEKGLTDDPPSHDFTSEVYRRNNGSITGSTSHQPEERVGGGREKEREGRESVPQSEDTETRVSLESLGVEGLMLQDHYISQNAPPLRPPPPQDSISHNAPVEAAATAFLSPVASLQQFQFVT